MRRSSKGIRIALGLLTLAIALSVLISATMGDRASLTLPEKALRAIFEPIGGFFWSVGRSTANFFRGAFRLSSIMEENEDLRQQIDAMRAEMAKLKGLEAENDRLSSLLDLKKSVKGKTAIGRVIYRDAGNWLGTLVIDKGTNDGIQVGMAVISSIGIVGRVVAASGSTATVLLANDPRNAIGAVTVRSRDFAIVEGVGDGTGVLKLKPLGDSPDLKAGDLVVSSGLGGIYPSGHIIGEIVDVDEGAYGIAKTAYVRSSVDFNRIEEVLVLLEAQKGAQK